MRTNIEELVIEKAIMHILDLKSTPVYSELPLDIPDKIYDLLKKHIVTSMKDEYSRIAKFDNLPNSVQVNCQTMLENDDESFVAASIEISKLFYDNMVQSRASSAYCVFCKYQVNYSKFIALLKLDFAQNYNSRVDVISGKRKTAIELTGYGVPSSKQKLQKCFFYKPYSPDSEYDILLLDKQVGQYRDRDQIADYFMNFIRCKLARTSTECTRKFRVETENFINDNFDGDIEKALDLRERLYSILKSDANLDVTAFADGAFGDNEELKNSYLERISSTVGDYTFEIDKAWVALNLRKRKITTDNGIVLKIDERIYQDHSKFEIRKNEENSGRVDLLIKNVNITDKPAK